MRFESTLSADSNEWSARRDAERSAGRRAVLVHAPFGDEAFSNHRFPKFWGSNSHYQLGDTGGDRALPAQIVYFDPGRPVRAISAGYATGAAITSNGLLHTWGMSIYGSLGRSTPNSYATPGEVSALTSPVRAVSAGLYHMFAVVQGYAFAWGLNSYGQLGLGPAVYNVLTPTALFQAPVVKSISAGWSTRAK